MYGKTVSINPFLSDPDLGNPMRTRSGCRASLPNRRGEEKRKGARIAAPWWPYERHYERQHNYSIIVLMVSNEGRQHDCPNLLRMVISPVRKNVVDPGVETGPNVASLASHQWFVSAASQTAKRLSRPKSGASNDQVPNGDS